MFDFGKPSDTAQVFWEQALKARGPKVPAVPYDELEEADLRNVFAYLYMAVTDAFSTGASDAVVEVLLKDYDEVFVLLAEGTDSFREAVRSGRHQYVMGYNKESIQKYNRLAGI